MFTDFYEAFHYLRKHEMFQGRLEECLDIEVVKVNPLNKIIEDDTSLNTETNVWLECGKYSAYMRWHDIELDCGGQIFEEAIIELANLVKKNYGDDYVWVEDEKPDWLK